MVISSKVAACMNQPVALNRHLSIHECLTGLRNKPQYKQTIQILVVIIVSLVMELLIGGEIHPLTFCA